jgi:hypothetical protein
MSVVHLQTESDLLKIINRGLENEKSIRLPAQ